MFKVIIFFAVIAYFIFQLFISGKEKNVKKKLTGLSVGITIFIVALAGWPLYLNPHLVFFVIPLLFSTGMFYESYLNRNGFYFLTGAILILLSIFQLVEYMEALPK